MNQKVQSTYTTVGIHAFLAATVSRNQLWSRFLLSLEPESDVTNSYLSDLITDLEVQNFLGRKRNGSRTVLTSEIWTEIESEQELSREIKKCNLHYKRGDRCYVSDRLDIEQLGSLPLAMKTVEHDVFHKSCLLKAWVRMARVEIKFLYRLDADDWFSSWLFYLKEMCLSRRNFNFEALRITVKLYF